VGAHTAFAEFRAPTDSAVPRVESLRIDLRGLNMTTGLTAIPHPFDAGVTLAPPVCHRASVNATCVGDNPIPCAPKKSFSNFSGNCNGLISLRKYTPATLDDLVAIVKEAEAEPEPKHIRAVGSAWSFTTINFTPDYLVSTDALNKCLSETMTGTQYSDPVFRSLLPSVVQDFKENSQQKGLYHVEAGIKIHDLYCRLESIPNGDVNTHGYALPTLGGSGGQSLAGAISTSTHGGDIRLPPLPDMVRGIHLVGAGGEEFFIQRASQPIVDVKLLAYNMPCVAACGHIISDDDVFNSVVVSMGRMGIIYSLVIEVRDQFFLEETTLPDTWPNVQPKLQTLRAAKNNRFLQVLVMPYGDAQLGGIHRCFVTQRTESKPPLPFSASPCPAEASGDPFNWLCRQDLGLQTALVQLITGSPQAVLSPAETAAEWIACNLDPVNLVFGLFGATIPLCASARAVNYVLSTLLGPNWLQNPKTLGKLLADDLDLLRRTGATLLAGQIVSAILQSQIKTGTKTGISYAIMDTFDYNANCDLNKGLSIEVAFDADQVIDGKVTYIEYVNWVLDQIAFMTLQRMLVACYISIRFCGRSSALLAIEQWDSTVCIEIAALAGLPGEDMALRSFEDHAAQLGAAVHWGQWNHRTQQDIEQVFGSPSSTRPTASKIDLWRSTLWHLSAGVPNGLRTFDNDFSLSHGLEADRSVAALLSDAFSCDKPHLIPPRVSRMPPLPPEAAGVGPLVQVPRWTLPWPPAPRWRPPWPPLYVPPPAGPQPPGPVAVAPSFLAPKGQGLAWTLAAPMPSQRYLDVSAVKDGAGGASAVLRWSSTVATGAASAASLRASFGTMDQGKRNPGRLQYASYRYGSGTAPSTILVNGQPIDGVTGAPGLSQSRVAGRLNLELLAPMGAAIVHFRQGAWQDASWQLVDILPPLPVGSLVTCVQVTESDPGSLEVFAVVVPPLAPNATCVATPAVPSFHRWLLQSPAAPKVRITNGVRPWLRLLVDQPVTDYPAHSLYGLAGVPKGLDLTGPGAFRLEPPRTALRNRLLSDTGDLGVSTQPRSLLVRYFFDPEFGWTGPFTVKVDGIVVDGVTGVPAIVPGRSSGSRELFVPRGSQIHHYEETGPYADRSHSFQPLAVLPSVAPGRLVGQVFAIPAGSGNVEIVARVGKISRGFGAYGGDHVSYTGARVLRASRARERGNRTHVNI
jgi:hypothetical protein